MRLLKRIKSVLRSIEDVLEDADPRTERISAADADRGFKNVCVIAIVMVIAAIIIAVYFAQCSHLVVK